MDRLKTIKYTIVSAAIAANFTLPVCSETSTPYLEEYIHPVAQKIEKNWLKPKIQPEKKVVVVFKIELAGEVSELKCQHSSGSKQWDESALDAIRNSSPFDPIPQDWDRPMELQYTFDPKRAPAKEPVCKCGMIP
jgi:TonB family protein